MRAGVYHSPTCHWKAEDLDHVVTMVRLHVAHTLLGRCFSGRACVLCALPVFCVRMQAMSSSSAQVADAGRVWHDGGGPPVLAHPQQLEHPLVTPLLLCQELASCLAA